MLCLVLMFKVRVRTCASVPGLQASCIGDTRLLVYRRHEVTGIAVGEFMCWWHEAARQCRGSASRRFAVLFLKID